MAGHQEPGLGVERLDEEIPLGSGTRFFRKNGWKILLLSGGTGLLVYVVLLFMPNWYESSATIAPAKEENKPSISLGALASSFGLLVGGPTRIEDLETIFRSREATIRVFRKHDLWPVIYPDSFDPKTGRLKVGWKERLFGGEEKEKQPSDWDAIRAVEDRLDVRVSRKMGTVTVAFECRSAQGSADIVRYYLEEGKTLLQEKALERAAQNKAFLEQNIGRIVDPIIRDRLYTLFSQEVEKEMLARNRGQFGFTVLDPPLVPDRRSWPKRVRTAGASIALSFPVWIALLWGRGRWRSGGNSRD